MLKHIILKEKKKKALKKKRFASGGEGEGRYFRVRWAGCLDLPSRSAILCQSSGGCGCRGSLRQAARMLSVRVAAAVARALPRRAGLVSAGAWAGGRGRGWRILRSGAGLCRAVQRGAGADGAILHRGCSAARTAAFAGLRWAVVQGMRDLGVAGQRGVRRIPVLGGGSSRGEGQGLSAVCLACSEACSWGPSPLKVKGAVSSFVRVTVRA